MCITVDGQTVEDGTVTVRMRDSMAQQRVAEAQIVRFVADHIRGENPE